MCEAHIQDAPTTCRRTNVRGQHHKGGKKYVNITCTYLFGWTCDVRHL